jgi:hypothetical protein
MVTVAAAGTVIADPLSDASEILCTVLDTHICVEAAGCADVLAEEMNIPRFVKVDTRTRKLSTTQASGENRETAVDAIGRADGQIVLQGTESGRAFSLLIDEATGSATFAAAAEGRSVTTFGVFTPVPMN